MLLGAGVTGTALYHGARLTGKGVVKGGQALSAVLDAGQTLAMATRPETRTKDYNESLGRRVVGKTAKILARSLMV